MASSRSPRIVCALIAYALAIFVGGMVIWLVVSLIANRDRRFGEFVVERFNKLEWCLVGPDRQSTSGAASGQDVYLCDVRDVAQCGTCLYGEYRTTRLPDGDDDAWDYFVVNTATRQMETLSDRASCAAALRLQGCDCGFSRRW